MRTNLYEFVMDELRSTRFTRDEIARESGVPLSTLNKIATASIKNPGVKHVQALANYFEGLAAAAVGR